MLSCVRIFVKRNYPGLHVMVINCEILGVIYTFFRVFGNEKYGKWPGRRIPRISP